MGFQILLQAVLILVNAFFAASEIALISLNEKKVQALAEGGDKKAAKMLKVIENPTGFLSAIQIGITLAGFLGSAFAADNFASRLTAFVVKSFNVSPELFDLIDTVSVILITLILSYFTLVLGELVPKRLAMKYKEPLARAICGFMSGFAKVLKPIIWFLTVSTNLILRIFRIDPKEKEESVSEEDIVIMLDAGKDEGKFPEEGIRYIKNVFKLDRLTAYDVMTPRAALVAAPSDISPESLTELIAREGYSRLPIYDEGEDKIIGVISTKEFLLRRTEPEFKLDKIIREAEFVPEGVHLDDLLLRMQRNHLHIALVVDEYGSVSGVVSMEDILEEIVGEIWDEEDEETTPISENSDGSFTVSALVSLETFFEFFKIKPQEEYESATLNGWILDMLGYIPDVGYSFDYEGLSAEITEADEQRIIKLRLRRTDSLSERDS